MKNRLLLLTVAALIAAPLAPTVSAQTPEGVAESDWTSIRAAYEQGRHRMFAFEGGHHARTHRQRFTTEFDGRGATVAPDHGEWSFGLELVSYGRAGDEALVDEPRSTTVDGRRIAYAWDDTLTEWYVNRDRGLEHGFTVHARPAGDGELVVELRVRGSLAPDIDADGLGASFWAGGERAALTYDGLVVLDAGGAEVPAALRWSSGLLQVRVDDASAQYPLEIDPLIQQAYLKATGDGPYTIGDEFGYAVALSGDTIVVGAPNEDSGASGVNGDPADASAPEAGAAYVFVRDGTTWKQQAYLKASNAGAGDEFGQELAIDGDTIVIAARREDSSASGVNGDQANNGSNSSGAAYVFVRSGTTWTQQAYLKASNRGNTDLFGGSVDIDADTIVVGAHQEDSAATGVNGNETDNSAATSGAAYVFVRDAGIWSQEAYLKASNTEPDDAFGWDVAVDGERIIVSAHREESDAVGVDGDQSNFGAIDSGAAYLFTRSAGVWSQEAYLKASNTDAFDLFGYSVALSGDTAVVGALSERSSATGVGGDEADDSALGAGAAYVFAKSGGVWAQQAYLKASNTDASDNFGVSVAIDGDTVVVGARRERSNSDVIDQGQANNSATDAGAAYVFVRNAGVWSQEAYLKASNSDADDSFGRSVAVAGDRVLVGAEGESSWATGIDGDLSDDLAPASGAAYLFERSGATWTAGSHFKAGTSNFGDGFGTSVAVSGSRVVVGAPGEDSGQDGVDPLQVYDDAPNAGAVYVFGEENGAWSLQAYLKASNSQAGDGFGTSVASDANRIVVGAPGEASDADTVNGNQGNNAAAGAGAAYLFQRNSGNWSQLAYFKALDSDAGDQFGQSVAISDLTVAIGAPGEDSSVNGVGGNSALNDAVDAGAVYVYARIGSTWTHEAYVKAKRSNPGDAFGCSIGLDGDTLVVGACSEDGATTGVNGNQLDNGATDAGAAYVFERSSGTWAQQAYLKASNTDVDDNFGCAVDVSGDLVAVGASREDSDATGVDGDQISNAAPDSGAAYVFRRVGSSWSQDGYVKATNSGSGDRFGWSVAIDDALLLVGAPEESSNATGVDGDQGDDSATGAGAAYLYARSGLGWVPFDYLKSSNADAGDRFGTSVDLSETLLAVGAPGEDSASLGVDGDGSDDTDADAGAAYAFWLYSWTHHVGCLGNPATWAVPTEPARLGTTTNLELNTSGVPLGVAAIYYGAIGVDGSGCGTPFGTGELLLGFAPFPELLALVPVVSGAATHTLSIPPKQSLVGVRVTLQAVVIDTLTFADELSTGLEFEIRP